MERRDLAASSRSFEARWPVFDLLRFIPGSSAARRCWFFVERIPGPPGGKRRFCEQPRLRKTDAGELSIVAC